MSKSSDNGGKTQVPTFADVLYRVHIRALFDIILHKNPTYTHTHTHTHIYIYINTTLFTLKHSNMFQPSGAHSQGVLTHFVSRVNKTRDTYFVDHAHEMLSVPLRAETCRSVSV
jgi:hypothetical protein